MTNIPNENNYTHLLNSSLIGTLQKDELAKQSIQ